ncbi:MAG: right-handed parallel beta-helix repeat-containing protein [Flavobacteriales bacterium]|nr:right-handed parallel beta-helix repeat-containing protein [Flavobacteriales bacterium]
MKRQMIVFILLMTAAFTGNATILTVNNNTALTNVSAGQYTSVPPAITAASPGDTLYIHGSPTPYPMFVVFGKNLTIIGTGFNPDNQFGFKSTISGDVRFIGTATAGSRVIGLDLVRSLTMSQTQNISISRCKIGERVELGASVSNVEIINNVIIDAVLVGNNSDVTISNNILRRIVNSNKNSVTVTNNVFHYIISNKVFWSVTNIVFANNVLQGVNALGCEYCAMNNNMASDPTVDFGYSMTNSIGDNSVGVGPLYDVTASPGFISLSNDYTLQPGSPALAPPDGLGGSDGSDVGITGGAFPFDLVEKADSPIPQIYFMNMTKSNVPQGDDIQFNVKVRTQN